MKLDPKIFIQIPPPVVALALLAVAGLIHRLLPFLDVMPSTPFGGFVWSLSGLALTASAALQFRKLKTTVLPHGKPTELVTLGAYLWTRNPMYLGLLTALIGVALVFGTLPFFLAPWFFFLIINEIQIPYEEAVLSQKFGAAYERYLKRVRRWI